MCIASGAPPGRARPARPLRWPARTTSIIWNRWRKCWAIKSPWSGPETTGLLPINQSRLPLNADRASEDPAASAASIGPKSARRHQPHPKKTKRVPFQAHFLASALNLPKAPTPLKGRIRKSRPPKKDRDTKKRVLPGLLKKPSPLSLPITVEARLHYDPCGVRSG